MESNVKICSLVIGIAALMFSSAAALEEASDQTLFETGVTRLQEGDFQGAVDLFTEVVLNAPTHAKSYKNRGVALMRLERYDLAITDFNRALSLDPGLIGIYSNLGAAWHYKKEYTRAVENYDREIAMRPGEYITYFNRALSRIELGHYDQALSDLETALTMKPDLEWASTLKRQVLEKLTAGRTATDKTDSPEPETKTSADLKSSAPEATRVKDPGTEEKLWPYAVQTGAYTEKAPAQNMMDRLASKGYEAWILELPGADGRTWYLVRTGRHLGYSKALQLTKILKKDHNITAVVCTLGKF